MVCGFHVREREGPKNTVQVLGLCTNNATCNVEKERYIRPRIGKVNRTQPAAGAERCWSLRNAVGTSASAARQRTEEARQGGFSGSCLLPLAAEPETRETRGGSRKIGPKGRTGAGVFPGMGGVC